MSRLARGGPHRSLIPDKLAPPMLNPDELDAILTRSSGSSWSNGEPVYYDGVAGLTTTKPQPFVTRPIRSDAPARPVR